MRIMKDCWKILEIDKTTDAEKIKKAYRELIKRYHPDTVRSPEKIRKYTIKSAEIIEAYKQAVEYAKAHQLEHENITKTTPSKTYQTVSSTKPTVKASPHKKDNLFFRVIAAGKSLIIICISILLFLEIFGIYPGISRISITFSTWVNSLPLENPVRMIISGLFASFFGLIFSGILTFFTLMYLLTFLAFLFGVKGERYIYKVGFFILTVLSIFLVYYATLYWPFKNSTNDYYIFLYRACRFFACFSGPFCLLAVWLNDIIKYTRIKNTLNSNGMKGVLP
jgi:hypothetical protein